MDALWGDPETGAGEHALYGQQPASLHGAGDGKDGGLRGFWEHVGKTACDASSLSASRTAYGGGHAKDALLSQEGSFQTSGIQDCETL